jgi:hypothetical protein
MATGPTVTFLKRRELVLGRRLSVSRDPELAAVQLAEQLGGDRLAHQWLLDALTVLEHEHPATRKSA